MVIWGAFSGFDKCPIVFISCNRWIGINFVNVVHEGCFSGFNFIHYDLDSLQLTEDGAQMHKKMTTIC